MRYPNSVVGAAEPRVRAGARTLTATSSSWAGRGHCDPRAAPQGVANGPEQGAAYVHGAGRSAIKRHTTGLSPNGSTTMPASFISSIERVVPITLCTPPSITMYAARSIRK